MKTYFYSHLVKIDFMAEDLSLLKLTPKEKERLLAIAHKNLHHEILDVILSELSQKDKITFLSYLHRNENDKIWEHLNSKIEKIEEKIIKVAQDLKKELKADIYKIK